MRCINYHTAKRRCNSILRIIQEADPDICKKIASIIVSDNNINKITSPLMGILVDCFGEIKPWLTKSNHIPYKNRGLRPGVRRPLQMIIHALRTSAPDTGKITCALCEEDKIFTNNSCAVCSLLSSIQCHFKLNKEQVQTHTTKKSPPVPYDNNKNQKDLLETLSSPITSPLIKANIRNELKTLKSIKKRKNNASINTKSLHHTESNALEKDNHGNPPILNITTHSPVDSPHITKIPRPPHATAQKSNSPQEKKNITAPTVNVSTARNLLKDLNKCEIKENTSDEQNNSGLRIKNQILRSSAMNSILSKINKHSDVNFHIANSNLLSYLSTQEYERTKNIPEAINFPVQKAKKRDLGTYFFPIFLGSFHQGNWVSICIKKVKTSNTTNVLGWVFDPAKMINKNNKIPEILTLEAKHFFNKNISWEFPSCLPLKERECGPRCVTTCLILALAIQFDMPWQTAIKEACNLSITEEKLAPHLCREITFKIDSNLLEVWDTKFVFPIHKKTIESKIPSENIASKTESVVLNKSCDKFTIEIKGADNFKKNRKRKKRDYNTSHSKIQKKKMLKKKNTKGTDRKIVPTKSQKHTNGKKRGERKEDSTFSRSKALGNRDINSTDIRTTPNNDDFPKNTPNQSTNLTTINQKEVYKNERKESELSYIQITSNSSHIQNTVFSKTRKNIRSKQATTIKTNNSWDYQSVHQILYSTDDIDSIISQIGNSTITKRNIQTLKPETWLNDEVINTFLALAIKQHNRTTATSNGNLVHCFNSFFFTKLCQNNAYSYENVERFSRRVHNGDIFCLEKLIIPININGNHWTIVCINFSQKSILYLDSLGGQSTLHTKSCIRYLQDEYMRRHHSPLVNIHEWSIRNNREGTPKQKNNYDCGVFVCLYALHLIRNEPFNFTQADINRNIRPWIAKAILQKRIPNTSEGYCDTSL